MFFLENYFVACYVTSLQWPCLLTLTYSINDILNKSDEVLEELVFEGRT